MNATAALAFLGEIGVDLSPDPANIPDLRRAGWSNETIAETYGVSVRTIQRYHRDQHPCPGYPENSCLTKVRGGGLCTFCRKTKAE
jgi:hypothetical protein